MQSGSFHSLLKFVVVMAMLTALGACSTPKYTDYEAFMKKPRPPAGGKPYVIEPPDTVSIIAPTAPEIHGSTLTLRPDGYVTMYLLGDLFAAGKTPTQLASEIEEKVMEFYDDVKVQVEVVGFNSKVYYMAGESGSPGPKRYTGKDTVLDAVLGSGIPRTAWPEKAVVLRPNEEGELVKRMSVNLREMYEKGHLRYNALLEEGDIVYIPINPLAAVGVMVQNLLSPVDPVIRVASTPARAETALNPNDRR